MLPYLVPGPTYELAEIRSLIAGGFYWITKSAMDGAFALGFDDQDIRDCVGLLNETHFHKTMPSQKMVGLMQDVYGITYEQKPIYLKIQIRKARKDVCAVVISFKTDESAQHRGEES